MMSAHTLHSEEEPAIPELRIVKKDQWVSVSQAAEILGVSRQTVHAMIKRGDLSAERVPFGSRFLYRIRRADLDAVEVKPTGRPPKNGG